MTAPRDLDAAPDPDAPPVLVLPVDTDPASWSSLEDFEAALDGAIDIEAWGELQEVAEDG